MELACVGVRYLGGTLFWHKHVKLMYAFLNDKDEATLEPMIIRWRNTFMRIKKTMGGPTMDLSCGQQLAVAMKTIGVPLTPSQTSEQGKTK